MTDFQSLYSLRPRMGERLRHRHGRSYVYAGVTAQGKHFAQGEDGNLYPLTEGDFWAREPDLYEARMAMMKVLPAPVIPSDVFKVLEEQGKAAAEAMGLSIRVGE